MTAVTLSRALAGCCLVGMVACAETSERAPDASVVPDAPPDGYVIRDAGGDGFVRGDMGVSHAASLLESLADPRTGERVEADFSCLGAWARPDRESRSHLLWYTSMEMPPFEREGFEWGVFGRQETSPIREGDSCGRDYFYISPRAPDRDVYGWQGGVGYQICEGGNDSARMVHYAHELFPHFVRFEVFRSMNLWTPRYADAVLAGAGRDPEAGRDHRLIEVLAHDCSTRFVGGFGVLLSVGGREVELTEEQLSRPRLTLPDGSPYHMESLVIFDVPLTPTPGADGEVVIRTTGRLTPGGPEILLGCEAATHDFDSSMSLMVSPLRGDYPMDHPCRRYL